MDGRRVSREKPSVVIYTGRYGYDSEVWIHRHATGLGRYMATTVAGSHVNRDRFPNAELRLLPPEGMVARGLQRAACVAALRKWPTWRDDYRWSLARMLRSIRPVAIHVHFLWDAMGFVADAAADARVPLVVTAHGPDIHRAIVDDEWRRSVKGVVERSSRIIAVSDAMRARFLAIGCPAQKVKTLYLGAPLPDRIADVSQNDGVINVTCVAALRPYKGHRYLIDAFAAARQKEKRLRLLLIGDAETPKNRIEIEAQIAARGLGDCVRLAGWLAPDEVRSHLMRTHIYAQHSITTTEGEDTHPMLYEEGLPISFVEAAACGLPLVGTRTGGVPEICRHGLNGLVVDQKDVEGMADCLLDLAADPERRAAMGRASRMLVEAEFDQEKQLQKLEELYDEIALGASHPCPCKADCAE